MSGGKPPVDIDIAALKKLGSLQVTLDEVAAFFNCSQKSVRRYLKKPEYRDAWESGKASGRMSLRRLQWDHANKQGSSAVQMTIHLSKHWLGESEKVLNEHTGKDGGPLQQVTRIERVVVRPKNSDGGGVRASSEPSEV